MKDTQAQRLFDQALKLPLGSREDLAVRLLGSVELTNAGLVEIKQVWVEEIDERVARLESGQSQAVSIEEAWPRITGRPWQSDASEHG